MRSWTVHLPPASARPASPALIREGFSVWAFLFGPFWLFRHRAWMAGILVLLGLIGVNLLPGAWGIGLALAFHLLLGFHGQDLRRWTLARRGWRLAHVVQARDPDSALVRLLQAEPELLPLYAVELGR